MKSVTYDIAETLYVLFSKNRDSESDFDSLPEEEQEQYVLAAESIDDIYRTRKHQYNF